MSGQSDAFLSYTRIDDRFFGGSITSLRELLELGVQVVTGRADFNIFQDIDGIEFGQNWQRRLDQAIASTRFLIPIITPLFSQSQACRDELKKFFEHEEDRRSVIRRYGVRSAQYGQRHFEGLTDLMCWSQPDTPRWHAPKPFSVLLTDAISPL